MRHEILYKIDNLLRKPVLTESEVQHLMTLGRKLTDEVPRTERQQYALLRFYCDWSVHREIDRSAEGAEVLARIHAIVIEHLGKNDNSNFDADVTAALSLDQAREQFNALLKWFNGGAEDIVINEAKWSVITPTLAEIISNCPVSFPKDDSHLPARIRAILGTSRSQPIKGDSVVEQLVIDKVRTTMFNPNAPDDQITYCVVIITSDTTKLVTPLVKSR